MNSTARRSRPSAADLSKLLSLVADARRTWKVGEACLSYRLDATTSVVRFEERSHGRIAYLANGDSMHESKLRSPR